MRARLTSNRFVGRIGELAELQLAVQEAASERATLVLLGGDSGLGKTRLVAELERRLADAAAGAGDARAPAGENVTVLRGDGVEQSDGELPYAPLLGALRPLVRGHHPALGKLSAGSRAQLATILPGLDQVGAAGQERPDRNGQLQLFEALLELIDLLSQAAPVVLILEDMHWADRSTRAFVAFLARSLRQERVCMLLTYRADELHRRHPLRPLLSELERLDRARRVVLEPFDRDELREALCDILGEAPTAELLERLFQRSEGNPLFTEELLAAGLDGRGAAPQSLRDAFLVRIERLSDPAQRIARTVAVGRTLDEPALIDVTGFDRDAVQGALREAVAEQVLVADDEARFCFRHALLREALYDDLLPGERGELHIRLAEYLDQRCRNTEQGELERTSAVAEHFAAAGDQPAALRSTIEAARAAQSALASGEAARFAERALELWPRVGEAERVTGIDHSELLVRAAEAHRLADDRARSSVLLNEALRELDPDEDSVRYATVLARLARITWALNRGEQAVALGERALALIPEDEPGVIRPRLEAWLARWRFLRGRFRDAASDAERALEAAIGAGDPLAEADARNTLGMARVALGQVDEGVALLRRSIELAGEHGDYDGLATAHSNLADMLTLAGRTQEALAAVREGLAATPRRHARSYQWLVLTLVETAFLAGDWQLAKDSLWPAPSQSDSVLYMFGQLREADVALGAGDDERAAECLQSVAPFVAVASEPQWIGLYGSLAGELALRRGDLDAARAAVQEALDRLELCTDDVMRIARVTAVGLSAEAERALRARDLKDARAGKDARARMRIHLQRLKAAAQDGGPVERAQYLAGAAQEARGRGRNDAGKWSAAAAAWEALERPHLAACARAREAEALVEAGDRAGAAAVAVAAYATASRLGAGWLCGELEGLAARGRLDLDAREADRSGDSAPDAPNGRARNGRARNGRGGALAPVETPFGLTPRELQVLSMIAAGATNRQIGASLYMAEKTASVHVSRILGKLGVSSRTQAAAIAHRQHLA
jgi:DNA-binding CsgD family transcriptional regulator/tetratricopeptide (TPR) repeat protein